ncbi:hypothetical protein D3C80_1828530 [compost metagenome]
MLVLELVILQQQQQGLEHGDGEHAVRQDRQQDMGEDARLFVDQWHRAGWCELGDQGRQHAQREQQYQQVFHRDTRAGDQRQGNDGHGDQAGGTEKVQAKAKRRQQLHEQGAGMAQYR